MLYWVTLEHGDLQGVNTERTEVKANEYIDEFEKVVDRLESNAEHAGLAKLALRRIEALDEVAERIKNEVNPGFEIAPVAEGTVEYLRSLSLTETDSMKELVSNVKKAVEVADIVEGINVDKAKGLLERYAAVFSRKTSVAREESGMRAVGSPIYLTCGCGFERSSPKGDWTSIRYQAKVHAAECEIANPGLGDSLTNDLDRVRDALITRRENTHSGGLQFKIG